MQNTFHAGAEGFNHIYITEDAHEFFVTRRTDAAEELLFGHFPVLTSFFNFACKITTFFDICKKKCVFNTKNEIYLQVSEIFSTFAAKLAFWKLFNRKHNMATQEETFKKLVAHCKEYGFVFPSSEIYDGLGAVYDYGQNGVELKNNIKRYWWDSMTLLHENIVGIDAAIFMHPTTWKASGHVDAFNDPLIDNRDSKKRYRADVLIEDQLAKIEDKINKEVEKAAKRFGESFDEAMFRQTNPRVMEHQQHWDALRKR